MKTDSSIKDISLAAIRRHSIDIEKWAKTNISVSDFPLEILSIEAELPVVYFNADKDNWTLVTTRRVIGQIKSAKSEINFVDLDNYTWGLFKNKNFDKTTFRLTDIYGEQFDFLMETGNPSMAIIYSIRTIDGLYKSTSS